MSRSGWQKATSNCLHLSDVDQPSQAPWITGVHELCRTREIRHAEVLCPKSNIRCQNSSTKPDNCSRKKLISISANRSHGPEHLTGLHQRHWSWLPHSSSPNEQANLSATSTWRCDGAVTGSVMSSTCEMGSREEHDPDAEEQKTREETRFCSRTRPL